MAKTYTCEFCGAVKPHLGGQPRRCPACRDPKHRQRDLRRLETREGKNSADEARAAGAPSDRIDMDALNAAAPKLLALGLTVFPKNAEQAANYMGLGELVRHGFEGDDGAEWLKKTKRAARKERALLQRRPAALGEIAFATLGAFVIRTQVGLGQIPPSSMASLAKALAQTIELLQGGMARPAYTELNLIIPKDALPSPKEKA